MMGGYQTVTMTKEQRTAADHLKGVAPGYRVTSDSEGWPVIEGRYGRIEHHDGATLALYTTRRIKSELLAIPGVRSHQTGDLEARMLFPASALGSVARALKSRRKSLPSSSQLANLARGRKFVATPTEPEKVQP
jgi:hypothetical protein